MNKQLNSVKKQRVVAMLKRQADKLLQIKTSAGWETAMERLEMIIQRNKLAPGEEEEDGWTGRR